ncbi:MAG: methylated-DNA--[protein]-cysteine S-methyltransferase [Actinobacteria bacterium]|nr:methylated-DNA--[protein]-cysteine S-methyltransferase [Actinomycetota bacterium]
MTVTLSTPIGPVVLDADDDGITWLSLDGSPPPRAHEPTPQARAHLVAATRELDEYFDGRRTGFDCPLSMRGTPFQRTVWAALLDIPYGETISYGELAHRVGAPRAARAVGLANGRNPVPIVVPCHRVIGANGTLTGYGGGLDRKRWLLAHEAGRAQLPLSG